MGTIARFEMDPFRDVFSSAGQKWGTGMRFPWKFATLMLGLWVVILGSAQGQIPGPPAAPTAPGVPAAPTAASATTATAGPAPKNFWTFFCLPPGCHEKCKERYCNSALGRLIGSMMAPVRMMSGGLITPYCPTANTPNPADLAKSPESAAGAAARIKKEEAEAKERRADVRFLGTVDCNRYPEAEIALIKALRTDRNECVRFEAAIALGKGCCCTKKTIEALLLTVTGSDKDGNPVETSPRVLDAANYALSFCQPRVPPSTAEPPEKAVPLPEPKRAPGMTQGIQQVGFNLPSVTPARPQATQPLPSPAPVETVGVPTGQRGLFQIFMRRAQPSNEARP